MVGVTDKNRGLILKLRQEQKKGENGWLKGRFDVIGPGTGTYQQYSKKSVGRTLNAKEMIDEMLELINISTGSNLRDLPFSTAIVSA